MKSSRQGEQAEEQACDYLRQQGLRLVEKNYRCRHGEIDLIMKDGAHTVFVEVRYRQRSDYGGALASIDHRKRKKLSATALHYLQKKASRDPARFDVVAISGDDRVDWVPNAFET